MTPRVKRGAYRATCPNCPLDVVCTSQGLANKSMRMHSCERQHRLADMAARVRARRQESGVKRDCEHKYANHQHGTSTCYVVDRCRCRACRDANNGRTQARSRAQAYGRYANRVDAQPAREHLELLRANGIGYKQSAKLAGVAYSTVGHIIYGRTERNGPPSKRIHPSTAARILAVQPTLENMAGGAIVPDGGPGTQRRLQALVAMGWSQSRLAEQLGSLPCNIGLVIHGRTTPIAATVRAVRDLYDREWGHVQEGHDQRSRISVSRALNYAAKHGWVPPLAWDEDTIDDPEARPASAETVHATRASRTEQRIEDIEFLVKGGTPVPEIITRLGLPGAKNTARWLYRYDRPDLAKIIDREYLKRGQAADYTGRTR